MNLLKTLITNLFILILASAMAESPFVHVVIQEEPGKVLQYAVMYQQITMKTNPLVSYYWHSNGKIATTKGDFSGNLLHGSYEEFDRQGRLTGKGTFCYGVKDGTWRYWDRNGEITDTEKWGRGFLKEKMSIAQNRTIVEHYKGNRLQGKRIIYENSKPVTVETYRSGILRNKNKKLSLKSVFSRLREKRNPEKTEQQK